MRAVYNAPEEWEEEQMVTAMRGALCAPLLSAHLWLLAKPTNYERALVQLAEAAAARTLEKPAAGSGSPTGSPTDDGGPLFVRSFRRCLAGLPQPAQPSGPVEAPMKAPVWLVTLQGCFPGAQPNARPSQ